MLVCFSMSPTTHGSDKLIVAELPNPHRHVIASAASNAIAGRRKTNRCRTSRLRLRCTSRSISGSALFLPHTEHTEQGSRASRRPSPWPSPNPTIVTPAIVQHESKNLGSLCRRSRDLDRQTKIVSLGVADPVAAGDNIAFVDHADDGFCQLTPKKHKRWPGWGIKTDSPAKPPLLWRWSARSASKCHPCGVHTQVLLKETDPPGQDRRLWQVGRRHRAPQGGDGARRLDHRSRPRRGPRRWLRRVRGAPRPASSRVVSRLSA